MYSHDQHQEALHANRNPFQRRESALRDPSPASDGEPCERRAYRQGIEEIIMESVTERTREYILRRIAAWA